MSMTLAKRLLRDLLEANLPTELERLDAWYGDDIITPPPEDYHTAETVVVEAFPHVELVGIRSTPKGESDVRDYMNEITVLFTLIGDDELTLTTQVERCLLATRNVTFRTQLATELDSGPMIPGTEDYSMLSRTKAGFAAPLIKGGAITVMVHTLDDAV